MAADPGETGRPSTRSKSRRLFFALWPATESQRAVELSMRPRVEESGGRPVPMRNLHVTLAFLGEVPENRLELVESCARSVETGGSFDLRFDRLEIWARSHVLCLTMERTPDALSRLFDRLRVALLSEQFEIRHEEYRPHVTLARDVRRRNMREPIEPIGWCVQEFVLVQSQRGSAGSEYAIIGRWAF